MSKCMNKNLQKSEGVSAVYSLVQISYLNILNAHMYTI